MRSRMVFGWLPLLAAACVNLDADERDPTIQVTVRLAGTQIDELELVQSPSLSNRNRDRERGPLTPALLARGIGEPPRADLWSLDFENLTSRPLRVTAPEPNGAYATARLWPETERVLFLAIGRRVDAGGTAVAVAAGRLVVDGLDGGDNAREVSLAEVDIEEWGTEPCVRYHAGDITTYLVRNSDVDCDGLYEHEDCRPDDYCDPRAPSGPLADNCVCP